MGNPKKINCLLYQQLVEFHKKLFSYREYVNISDRQLFVKLYMKARNKNIELVATLKAPSLLIIGVANSEANQSIKESYAVTAKI